MYCLLWPCLWLAVGGGVGCGDAVGGVDAVGAVGGDGAVCCSSLLVGGCSGFGGSLSLPLMLGVVCRCLLFWWCCCFFGCDGCDGCGAAAAAAAAAVFSSLSKKF